MAEGEERVPGSVRPGCATSAVFPVALLMVCGWVTARVLPPRGWKSSTMPWVTGDTVEAMGTAAR